MEEERLHARLGQTRQHLAQIEYLIRQQKTAVASMERAGSRSFNERQALEALEDMRFAYTAERDRLLAQIARHYNSATG